MHPSIANAWQSRNSSFNPSLTLSQGNYKRIYFSIYSTLVDMGIDGGASLPRRGSDPAKGEELPVALSAKVRREIGAVFRSFLRYYTHTPWILHNRRILPRNVARPDSRGGRCIAIRLALRKRSRSLDHSRLRMHPRLARAIVDHRNVTPKRKPPGRGRLRGKERIPDEEKANAEQPARINPGSTHVQNRDIKRLKDRRFSTTPRALSLIRAPRAVASRKVNADFREWLEPVVIMSEHCREETCECGVVGQWIVVLLAHRFGSIKTANDFRGTIFGHASSRSTLPRASSLKCNSGIRDDIDAIKQDGIKQRTTMTTMATTKRASSGMHEIEQGRARGAITLLRSQFREEPGRRIDIFGVRDSRQAIPFPAVAVAAALVILIPHRSGGGGAGSSYLPTPLLPFSACSFSLPHDDIDPPAARPTHEQQH
ncbi:hypothetical protein DBV15_08920 [Temnothorax longispinosus]|uniref:Uncharacterized protein n=1 Tax=Temnothorax longispinosus TaxID=300112 RepID=A0A4S2KCG0_9HYME|nr:hypothetical protein DBV15_08920 [Temnothorax longispinosus]